MAVMPRLRKTALYELENKSAMFVKECKAVSLGKLITQVAHHCTPEGIVNPKFSRQTLLISHFSVHSLGTKSGTQGEDGMNTECHPPPGAPLLQAVGM